MTSSITFYIIPEIEKAPALRFLCRLIEKAYAQKHQIYIHCDTAQEATTLNNLLWTFKDISFIPHVLIHENKPAPIQIGHQQPPENHQDILINLSTSIPDFHAHFNRIIELAPNIPEWKNASRQKFKIYKENNQNPLIHDLT